MQFGDRNCVQTSRKRLTDAAGAKCGAWGATDEAGGYDHNLQFYAQPPSGNIDLTEIQKIAVERLKLLKAVEAVRDRNFSSIDQFNSALKRDIGAVFPLATTPTFVSRSGTAKTDEAKQLWLRTNRRNDHIGHFFLRLAFSRSVELTKWFITQEVELFRYRFVNESRESIGLFFRRNGFTMDQVTSTEKLELLSSLAAASGLSSDEVTSYDFWKVPFIGALDLVRKRRVFLNDGIAYVPYSDLVVIITARFRQNMAATMAKSLRRFALVEADERIGPLLKRLSNRAYVGKNYATGPQDGSRVTPEMIDQLATISFPPCMRQCHKHLRSEHHMRHFGRIQYGLFLKGIGMTLDDAMSFWREEFTKNMDTDKFEKQYAYNIRHNYGKEGKRTEYSPFACAKIVLNNPPGPQDCHGCPFKHTDPTMLAKKLQSMGISQDQSNAMVDFVKESRYDRACTRFFETTHGLADDSLGQLITHPNEYFEQSRKLVAAKEQPVSTSIDST